MDKQFTVNVQINVGVTPELCGLLTALIGSRQQPTAAPGVAAPAEQPAPTEKPEKKPRARKTDAPVEQAAADPEPAPQPQQEADKKDYTEVDIRAAMDRTRKRIEGENYKEKTDSEGYKKWHRALTAWFMKIANELGAARPSALPDSDSRAKFIASCEAVTVSDNGELIEDLPQ